MKRNFRIGWWKVLQLPGACIAVLMLGAGAALAQQPELPFLPLNAGIYVIQAEVAGTPQTRQIGLMQRKSMPIGAGMLFLFDESRTHCMWMKNTLIPLSVAFIDERGRIVNIADMQPLDETSHCASRPARFALEMNQGWLRSAASLPAR
jgi:uncharacterized membrane protein (UPF0127 family)